MSRPYPPPQKIFSHWIYMIHLFRFQNGEFHRKVSDFHAWLKDRNIRHVIILFNSIVRVGRRLSRGRQRVITDRQRLFWNFQLVRVLHFFSIFQCFLRVCARFCCVFLRFFCILAHYHSLLLGMDFSSAHTAGSLVRGWTLDCLRAAQVFLMASAPRFTFSGIWKTQRDQLFITILPFPHHYS